MSLDAARIRSLLEALERELSRRGVVGEIGLCGGAVMCLVFDARRATKDIDAVFAPTMEIREAARAVGKREGLPDDWLNDAAKGYFLVDPPKNEVLDLPHLRVWAPSADYMLAMKCVSARFDSSDRQDVEFLLRRLGYRDPEEVFRVIESFSPGRAIPPKTRFLVEELLSGPLSPSD